MLQAPVLNGISFDFFSVQRDGLIRLAGVGWDAVSLERELARIGPGYCQSRTLFDRMSYNTKTWRRMEPSAMRSNPSFNSSNVM